MTTIFLAACVWLLLNLVAVKTAWAAEEPGAVQNLKMQILDLIFKVENLAGKVDGFTS